jgi:hypothetical protein
MRSRQPRVFIPDYSANVMKAKEKWFRRLADVPQINYPGSPGVIRTNLPGHNTVPEIDRYGYDHLMWPMGEDGSTSASPANQWKPLLRTGEAKADFILRQMYEKLELPGTLSDYHFAIQNGHDELQKQIRQAPWVLNEIERLCWLDIRLIEHYPETITWEHEGKKQFFGVSAFHRLIDLYLNEGYVTEAMSVAGIAERFDQRGHVIERLRERTVILEAENDAE